jgi:hypothetical protein
VLKKEERRVDNKKEQEWMDRIYIRRIRRKKETTQRDYEPWQNGYGTIWRIKVNCCLPRIKGTAHRCE